MSRRPPRSTRTDTLGPYTTLFRAQVRSDRIVIGKGPDAQHPVHGLERDRHPLWNIVRDQRRDADAEIDVIAVAELLGGAGGHLIAIPGHQRTPIILCAPISLDRKSTRLNSSH